MGEDLTKVPLPLIIIPLRSVILKIGVGGPGRFVSTVERMMGMRVSVYKLEDGKMSVLVESTPGKGRSPVMINGITPANIVAKVLPLVTQLRRPKGDQLELPM